ncbi:hypothetical protein ABK040_004756 [Willaertia magna]
MKSSNEVMFYKEETDFVCGSFGGKSFLEERFLRDEQWESGDFNCGKKKSTDGLYLNNCFEDKEEYNDVTLCTSFSLHEDHLYEEMRKMVQFHKKKAKQSGSNSDTQKIFIFNALTPKFVQKGDQVLITVPEEMQIAGFVNANLHLKIGYIEDTLDNDECFIKVEGSLDSTTLPTFCLCLEDKVLFDRMKTKREKIIRRKLSQEDKLTSSPKPKRKQKSC